MSSYPPSDRENDTLHILNEDAERFSYWVMPGPRVFGEEMGVCAERFSQHYGIWGESAASAMGSYAQKGKRVWMGPSMLQEQCRPDGANNILIRALAPPGEGAEEEKVIGHCFLSQWEHDGNRIWWITQLVVQSEYRNQKHATCMLRALISHYNIGGTSQKDFIGVLSSHPYTVCAVLRVFGCGIESLPSRPDYEETWKKYPHMPLPAEVCGPVMKSSPVAYVRDATPSTVSLTADTNFHVDHSEPDAARAEVERRVSETLGRPWGWTFGELPEGSEYMAVLEHKRSDWSTAMTYAGAVAADSITDTSSSS